MLPHYRKYGKVLTPMTDDDFVEGMEHGLFHHRKHKGYIALLYYYAVRKTEGLRAKREQFTITRDKLFFDVGKRLKHGIHTTPLSIRLEVPYVNEIVWAIEHTDPEQRVWNYCPKTGYNIVARVFKYPHFFRLSRITNFFLDGYSIMDVHSWTGLSLRALDFYLGLVQTTEMGESLGKKKQRNV